VEDILLKTVRRALERDRLSREESARIAVIGERLATLTPREHEVLASVIAGRLNKQIAAELTIAEKTVKVHRARVMTKMAVRSVAELVRIVQRASIPVGARPL
jgi:FixJ family two-component response regulator